MRFHHLVLAGALLIGPITLAGPAAADCEANTVWGPGDCADHHDPDCEDNQPAVGSANADGSGGVRFDGEYGSSPLPGDVLVRTCEGEHWDGDDHAQPENTNPTDAQANGACDATVAVLDGPGQDEPEAGPTEPLNLRVSSGSDSGSCAEDSSTYVHAGIILVGETAASVDTNDDGDVTVGWYGEDWTDLVVTNNVLARIISAAGITKGTVPETTTGDCDHDTYEEGRQTSDRNLCARDNTAITVEVET